MSKRKKDRKAVVGVAGAAGAASAFPAMRELNPAEQVWNDFKGHTANSLRRNKQDIRLNLHASARRVRRSGAKLRSFVLSSDLPSASWH
jgi:hypothetical protein